MLKKGAGATTSVQPIGKPAPFQPRGIDSGGSLVTNFCHSGVPRGLHGDQGCNFESRLTQEVLERLGVKIHITPLHLQSDGMVEHYMKTVKEHLRKVFALHRRD
jgi:hypothetical protein